MHYLSQVDNLRTMGIFPVSLFPCVLLTLAIHSVIGEQYPYKLNMITHATEIQNDWSRSTSYNSYAQYGDVYLLWCRKGFDLVKNSEKGKHFEYHDDIEVEPLKPYAFVQIQKDSGKANIAVVPAYRCPTSPAMYIHPDLENESDENESDEEDDNENEKNKHANANEPKDEYADENVIIWVLVKDVPSRPSLNNIVNYQFKIVNEIIEANLREMGVTSKNDIVPSVFDTDELQEAERQQMCWRVIRTVPDLEIEHLPNVSTGTSKYYVATAEMNRRDEESKELRLVVQAFDCPTVPKLYVNITTRDDPREGYILWAMTKKSEVKLRRYVFLDIMGYNVAVVKSIIKSPPLPQNIPEEDNGEQIQDESAFGSTMIETREANDESAIFRRFGKFNTKDTSEIPRDEGSSKVDLANSSTIETEMDIDDIDNLFTLKSFTNDGDDPEGNQVDHIDISKMMGRRATRKLSTRSGHGKHRPLADKNRVASQSLTVKHGILGKDGNDLTERERLKMCVNALKAVSVLDVEFTGRAPGASHYYAIETEWYIEIGDIVYAFECPTKPRVFLHLTDRESIERMVWVIVVGRENFEDLTAKFRK